MAPAHAKLLEPWAEQVAAASDGRISIRIYPSMQLGATPPQLFDRMRGGVADMVQELTGTELGIELDEVHLICAWAHDQGVIHSRKQITDLASLQGMKLRFPNRLTGESLTALGAGPIGMPVPRVPESLSSGVIDGVVVPWQAVPALKIQELVAETACGRWPTRSLPS